LRLGLIAFGKELIPVGLQVRYLVLSGSKLRFGFIPLCDQLTLTDL